LNPKIRISALNVSGDSKDSGSPTAQGRATAATTKEADNTGIMAKYGGFHGEHGK